ncbi:phosphoserine phosphatase SerB [Roseisalinus antarcticus]|uniref:Phosphoserine phosphatase n=1 Tax=Roseisalinus antarcticus TaxID=254357 RepID=A0A1Y5S6R8_9RHOB|nr:phosphoserine phosphatase SerB [Roseisalinus antarcticus]SLN33737.1 Phosphoserine phosphatase [Roseisalinus antarcticus]
MLTATLIAKPGALDPELVHSLRNAWGGGDAVWLSPDEAAEFPLMVRPGNLPQVWESLQAEGVDLCVQPTGHRRKKLLIADMDSTMIGQECIDELADAAGVGPQVAEITARAMNGELDFEGALIERVGLLAGLDASVIDTVLAERITDAPGGAALVATMKAAGAHALLVSGGFTAFAAPVAERLGFDAAQANDLLVEGGKLTGEVRRPILGHAAKVEALDRTVARLGLSTAGVLAVGDGANDLGMLGRAGMGVAVHAKPAVQAQCELRINHGDLTALLFLQGYARSDFTHPPEPEDYAV